MPKVHPEKFIEIIKKQETLLDEDELKVLYDLKDYLPQNARSLKKIFNDYLLIKAAYKDVRSDVMFKILILKHRWERCYNDMMKFGKEIFKETVKFVNESTENDYYKRDRILFCLRNKNYPSGFSFNTFQAELDQQTRFESEFYYFEYFKDYVFDPRFIKYIRGTFASFDDENIEEFLKDIPLTCLLSYAEDFQPSRF